MNPKLVFFESQTALIECDSVVEILASYPLNCVKSVLVLTYIKKCCNSSVHNHRELDSTVNLNEIWVNSDNDIFINKAEFNSISDIGFRFDMQNVYTFIWNAQTKDRYKKKAFKRLYRCYFELIDVESIRVYGMSWNHLPECEKRILTSNNPLIFAFVERCTPPFIASRHSVSPPSGARQ